MLACLYDIHGNLPALEAVLADARARGADRFVLGGDYALFGGWPRETVDLLRTLEDAVWIRGNVDRWAADPAAAPDDPHPQSAIRSLLGALDEQTVAELGALPPDTRLDDTRFVHASPLSDVRSFMPEPADDEQELLAGASDPRLVFGHTHLQFRRPSVDGRVELVNPGSVGMPLDGDHRAAYALIHPDGRLEQRRASYDHAAAIARLHAAFEPAPWIEVTAKRLERAAFDV